MKTYCSSRRIVNIPCDRQFAVADPGFWGAGGTNP